MAKRKAFIIRLDPEKLEALEKWATDEFRSMNGQVEWILDRAFKQAGRYKKKKNQER